jgi:transposase-like protein
MTNDTGFPETLIEAIKYFANAKTSLEFVASIRWPDGKACCPSCGKQNAAFLETRLLWKCRECKRQFSVKVGTIFEDSPIGLDKWLTAFWMIINAKNGCSSCEIARSLGVTQKTAWFMLHRIRLSDEYTHNVIDHAVCYAKGHVHTNGLENFWSLLKRGIRGTYVSVEPFHLFRYLDEQAFRFNERTETDAGRFLKGIVGIIGKRLEYLKLIGKAATSVDGRQTSGAR